jgi:hypothetical protein
MYTLRSTHRGRDTLSLVRLLVHLLLHHVQLLRYSIDLGLGGGLLSSKLLEVVSIRPALEEMTSLDAPQRRVVPEVVSNIFAHHPMGLDCPPYVIKGVRLP